MKRKAPTHRDRSIDRPTDKLRPRSPQDLTPQKQPFFSQTPAFFSPTTTDAFFQPSINISTSQTAKAAASNVPAPYKISFTHVNPPAKPDHSKPNPGPSGNAANRAGFTRVSSRPSLSIDWDHVSNPKQKGQIGLFIRSANVGFNIHAITVAISSKYPSNSCPYQVTYAHEYRHVRHFLKIFRSHRATMIKKAQSIPLPTAQAPHYITPAQSTAAQKQIAAPVVKAIRDVKKQIKADMNADRSSMDSPSSYAKEYAQCPKSAWK